MKGKITSYKAFAALISLFLWLNGCSDTKSDAELDLTGETAVVENAMVAVNSASGEWPQWLGPERNGKSSETGILTDWAANSPRVLWKIGLGDGFSGIAVSGGRAYTMFADGGDEYALCVDAASGRELWRVQTGGEFSDWQGGDGPRSTPAIDGERAYFFSAGGKLYALDARSGERIWMRDLKNEFNASEPEWGFCASPLIDGNKLLIEVGGRPDKALAALDKMTGRTIWAAQNGKAGYSSPIIITVDGLRQAIFFTGREILAVDPEDGSLYWKEPWKTSYDVNAATPVFIAPDRLFISSGYDVGGALYQISVQDGNAAVRQLWFSRGMKNKMNTSICHDGYLYGIDGKILKCLDAASGEEQWKTRGFGEGTLIMADGHLLVLSDRGVLGLVKATPERYLSVGEAKVLEGLCWTVPSLAGGRLFLRNQREMVCLEIK